MSRRNEINADFQDPASNEWLHVLKGKNAHLTSVNIKAKYKNGKGKSRTPPQKKKYRSSKTDMYGFPCLLRHDDNKTE